MSEQHIQDMIYFAIKSRHETVGVEISVLNRCIDIAYLNGEQELITIEIKLRDWRQAVRQALDHQIYADRSYICLPKPQRSMNPDLEALLEDSGIGLIWFEAESLESGQIKMEEVKAAKRNTICWMPARRKVENMLYA